MMQPFCLSVEMVATGFCTGDKTSRYQAPSHPMKMELVRSESGLRLNYWPYANVRAVYVAH